MVVVANIVSLFAQLVDFFAGLKFNEKSKIILCNLLSSSLNLITMILLDSRAGIISVIITLIRLITIYFKDKYNLKSLNMLFPVFIGLYALTFTDNNVVVALTIFFSNMCSFIPKWVSKDMQKIRIGALFANIIIIISNIMIKNYSAVPFNVFAVVSISIQLIKWYRQEKHRELNKNEVID